MDGQSSTTSATGSLQTGDTITVGVLRGLQHRDRDDLSSCSPASSNCSAVVNGVGAVATITLADSGGTCNVGDSTTATFNDRRDHEHGHDRWSTETVKTSADTTATNAAVTILAAGKLPTAVTVSATTLVAYARATWTVNFSTPTATRRAPRRRPDHHHLHQRLLHPGNPDGHPRRRLLELLGHRHWQALELFGLTITLAARRWHLLAHRHDARDATIAGITNTSPGSSIETVKTSNDSIAETRHAQLHDPRGRSDRRVVHRLAGIPPAPAPPGRSASTATSALLNGDTIVNLPAGFSLPATPTITLTVRDTACAATGTASGTTLISSRSRARHAS